MFTRPLRATKLLRLICVLGLLFTSLIVTAPAQAQEPNPPLSAAAVDVQSSPFPLPQKSDETFVIGAGAGLDSGCTYRNGGPLTIGLPVDRYIGLLSLLKSHGLIRPTATLTIAAFDIDSDPLALDVAPEVDQVLFNGVVKGALQGSNNLWSITQFTLSVDEILFPFDPGEGNTLTPKINSVQILIDTANSDDEVWCTAVDWVSLSIDVVKPVLFAHGIFSDGSIWRTLWQPQLDNRGIPNDALDLGALDSAPANATKIGNKIDSLQKRWGFDKLNVVSHSKGGIDTRLYVATSKKVDQLVMLATPNGGSPLADSAQSASVSLLGGGITRQFNLAQPGGLQLTTGSMATFNATVPANPAVTYLAIAGSYTFGGFGIKDSIYTRFYGGPNDQIVPVASVFSVPSITPVATMISTDQDDSATHGGIHSSGPAFQVALPFLTQLGAAASAGSMAPKNGPNRQYRQSVSADLTQPGGMDATVQNDQSVSTAESTLIGLEANEISAGEVQTATFSVESGNSTAGFLIYSEGANLFPTLVAPSGTRYLPLGPSENYASISLTSNTRMQTFAVENPEVGIWSVQISALPRQLNETTALYFVQALVDGSSLSLKAESDKEEYSVDEAVILSATLREDQAPVQGAVVEAQIATPGTNSLQQLTLQDDGVAPDAEAGDGIYTARFEATSSEGLYQVEISARGDNPAFQRSASLAFTVGDDSVRLGADIADYLAASPAEEAGEIIESAQTAPTGLIPDRPAVEDGPITILDYFDVADFFFGLIIDNIIVQGEVLVRTAGLYHWSGLLLASDGTVVGEASGSADLEPGSNSIQLIFDGDAIAESGLNGPFTIEGFQANLDDFEATISSGVTANYLASQFQGAIPFVIMDFTLNRLGGLAGGSGGNATLLTAVNNLNSALDPGLWLDPVTLDVDGLAVFDNTALAVQSLGTLTLLQGASTEESEFKTASADLTNATMHLSRTALDRAIAAEGDAMLIAEAESAWNDAAEMAQSGKSVEAVRRYRDAWEAAQRAAGLDVVEQNALYLPVVLP